MVRNKAYFWWGKINGVHEFNKWRENARMFLYRLMRSQHKALVNKTPAEILTGKSHNSWLEMLGFSSWYNQKAA